MGSGPLAFENLNALPEHHSGPMAFDNLSALPGKHSGPLIYWDLEVRLVGIKGKQIATGADGVATANLVDGVLSANSAGRAKIATNFYDEATVSAKFAANSIVAAKLKYSGETYDFSSGVLRAGTPTGTSDVANKDYVDNLLNGRSWIEPVAVLFYLGNRTVAQINALTPAARDAYVVTDTGTLTAGSLSVSAGDLVEYDGAAWQKIVAASGGFPPIGTRAIVGFPASGALLFSPLTDGSDEGKVAEWGGASLTPTLTTSTDGDAVLVKGSATNPPTSYDENKTFGFQGVVPTGSWNQTSGLIPFGSSIQSVGITNSAGTGGNVARDNHTHKAPAPTRGDKSKAPAATTGQYQDTAIDISFTPALGGHVYVVVNGAVYPVGDGNRDDLGDFTNNVVFYFSADGGATARAHDAIVATDSLYFNGTNAGFNLAATDEVSIYYEKMP